MDFLSAFFGNLYLDRAADLVLLRSYFDLAWGPVFADQYSAPVSIAYGTILTAALLSVQPITVAVTNGRVPWIVKVAWILIELVFSGVLGVLRSVAIPGEHALKSVICLSIVEAVIIVSSALGFWVMGRFLSKLADEREEWLRLGRLAEHARSRVAALKEELKSSNKAVAASTTGYMHREDAERHGKAARDLARRSFAMDYEVQVAQMAAEQTKAPSEGPAADGIDALVALHGKRWPAAVSFAGKESR